MAKHEFETLSPTTSQPVLIPGQPEALRHASWLLVQLELELEPLEEHLRIETLSEVEEHLRCSRLALEELGLGPIEADREAVEHFGSPARFARQVINSHKPKPMPQPALCLLTAASFLFLAFTRSIMDSNATAGVLGLWCAPLAFILLSWRARTFQWKALAKTGLAFGAFLTLFMGFAWVNLTNDGGIGESPRWALADLKARSEREMTLIPDAIKRCDPIEQTFEKGKQVVQNSRCFTRAGYLEYQMTGIAYAPFMPPYTVAFDPNYAQAARSWQEYSQEKETLQAYLEILPSEARACDLAARKPFDPIPASQGALGALFLTAVALLLNSCVFVLRSVWDLTARRIKRTLA